MASAGWYPDPAGTTGHYRYWDGSGWSDRTTTDPRSAPPSSGPPPKRSSRGVLALALVIVVLLVAGVLVVRAVLDPAGSIADPDPGSTVSGWDDSSPIETPTPPATATPTPADSPAGAVACPEGDPAARAAYPEDGRVHGGGISFPQVPGWSGPDTEYGMTWASDAAAQTLVTEPAWVALLAVGEVSKVDGMTSPKLAAEAVTQCMASSSYYRHFQASRPVWTKAVTVDGRPGWTVRTEVLVNNPGLSVPGDLVDVTVVDIGRPGTFSFFLGGVSIGDQARITIMDSAIAALSVG